MQKQEFENLTHLTNVSDKDYRKIEALYEELCNLDKQTFCEFLTNDLASLCAEAAEEISYWHGRAEDLKADNKMLANALVKFGDYDTPSEVYDTKTVIAMKLQHGILLSDEEVEYVKKNLK